MVTSGARSFPSETRRIILSEAGSQALEVQLRRALPREIVRLTPLCSNGVGSSASATAFFLFDDQPVVNAVHLQHALRRAFGELNLRAIGY